MLAVSSRVVRGVALRVTRAVAPVSLSASSIRLASTVSVCFVDKDGVETKTTANVGDSILDVALSNGIDIEAACEGECACSTCHIILEPDTFAKLDEMSEAEEDMLDLAAGLTDTSRLACQITLEASLDGIRVQLPAEVNNMLG